MGSLTVLVPCSLKFPDLRYYSRIRVIAVGITRDMVFALGRNSFLDSGCYQFVYEEDFVDHRLNDKLGCFYY